MNDSFTKKDEKGKHPMNDSFVQSALNRQVALVPPLSPREIQNAAIAKMAAQEGMVLLKNEAEALPLSNQKPVALFGVGAVRTVRGGTGSGDPFNGGLSGDENTADLSPRYHIHILPAMEASGFQIVNRDEMETVSARYDAEKNKTAVSPLGTFVFPDEALVEEKTVEYASKADTAVYVLSRNSGEGADRQLAGDYQLTEIELANLKLLRTLFRKLILVLNVASPVSVRDLETANADAILLMGQCGQEGGTALAEILDGTVSPSGKLTATWGVDYQDYPSADTYLSDDKVSLYYEGIYVGYRYFDTFSVKAGFPFGYGLSYTSFELRAAEAELHGTDLSVSVAVKNSGKYAGKEVVELYVGAPETEMEMPKKELRGFEKTDLLMPGEEETVTICVPLSNLSSYSERHGGYILSEGDYTVYAGDSVENTEAVAVLRIRKTVLVRRVDSVLPLQRVLPEIHRPAQQKMLENEKKLSAGVLMACTPKVLTAKELPDEEDRRSPYRNEQVVTYAVNGENTDRLPYETVKTVEKKDWTFADYIDGKVTAENLLAQFSDEELINFVCGTGWGVEDDKHPMVGGNSESVPGAAGETTHALEKKYGIPSIILADGPAGVRIQQHFEATNTITHEKQEVFHHCIAWPAGTCLAQSFNRDVLREVGRGLGRDLEAFHIGVLLGPGINIQRNPRCGRNFEYYSEDPLVTGEMAAAIVEGIQESGRTGACIKHFAANNQETNRFANDSTVGERALREIYLKPFQIAVEKSQPLCIMTSYNKINGIPAADSYDLCTNIARGEWGFKGLIMTDWNGGSSTPSISMHAGNDLIMPGGKTKEKNILDALKDCEPQFDERGAVKRTKIIPFLEIYELEWGSFRPEENGRDIAAAPLADHVTVEIRDGVFYTDGEPIYLEAATMAELRSDFQHFVPLRTPLTTKVAELSEDGRSILYHGTHSFRKTVARGDIERCAKNILNVIRELNG